MAVVQFFKTTSLPASPEPNSIYYVLLANGLYIDTYVTDASGNAKSAGVDLIDHRVNLALSGLSIATAEIVTDIDARDAYVATLEVNQLILVMDASDDPEVQSGSALYIYEQGAASTAGGGTVHRVPGFNGVNVTLAWDAITGKPSATPAQIDEAVAKTHTHSNKVVLDKFSENAGGDPLYDGNPIGGGGANWQGTPGW